MKSASIRRIVRQPSQRGPRLRKGPAPRRRGNRTLFRTLATGIDGTDEETAQKRGLVLPKGARDLVLGHEAVAEVIETSRGSALRTGSHVVPLVRQGCGSCKECRHGAVDLCASPDFTEHGIRGLHGFMQDLWTDHEDHVVPVSKALSPWAVLVEPLSIIVKGWEQSARIQSRLPWFQKTVFRPERALVVGAGSLAAMAALLLHHHGVPTTALDRHGDDAASSKLWRRLSVAHVASGSRAEAALRKPGFDLILETTGVPKVFAETTRLLASNGVMVLFGIPARPRGRSQLPSEVLTRLVVQNQVVFGSVNSNRAHFEEAIRILTKVRRQGASLFDLVVTHRFSPDDAKLAFATSDESVVKKVIDWNGSR